MDKLDKGTLIIPHRYSSGRGILISDTIKPNLYSIVEVIDEPNSYWQYTAHAIDEKAVQIGLSVLYLNRDEFTVVTETTALDMVKLLQL
jgi:hypothetical protein